jgi:hypothetical protein
MEREHGIVADLAERTGVAEDEVRRVLDEVGLTRTLDELEQSVQPDALQSVSADGLRLSVRVGHSLVAV